MWNENTKQSVADGKLVVIGIVQEQHAERARLYKQWKQYDFPIAQDAVTSLGLTVVPVPIMIDEYGYLMTARPRVNDIEKLVAIERKAPWKPAPKLNPEHVTSTWLAANAPKGSAASASVTGDAFLREGTIDSVRKAVHYYTTSLEAAEAQGNEPLTGLALFRLGVAHRSLFDRAEESDKDPDDFAKAAECWTLALENNPNQYIWRRRIQQYGPRQDKPYPFYDWVDQATNEIAARGETPVKLTVPLSGSEIAQPVKKFEVAAIAAKNPDPDGKIDQDIDRIVSFHATVVPQKVVAGETVRVHLRFVPDNGHWNNEAEEMLVWIDDSAGGAGSNSKLLHANAKTPSSDEPRTLEFEFNANSDASGTVQLKGYALYNVCTTQDGQCLYRRQDFSVPIEIESRQ